MKMFKTKKKKTENFKKNVERKKQNNCRQSFTTMTDFCSSVGVSTAMFFSSEKNGIRINLN